MLKFYGRYVDDALLVIRPENVYYVHSLLNFFDLNLGFTIDVFQNFLDLEIEPDGISIHKNKLTQASLYISCKSLIQ